MKTSSETAFAFKNAFQRSKAIAWPFIGFDSPAALDCPRLLDQHVRSATAGPPVASRRCPVGWTRFN